MIKSMKYNFRLPAIIAVALLAAACATTKSSTSSSPASQSAAPAPTAANPAPGATPPPAEVTEASLRVSSGTADFALRDDLKNVQFDYDSAKLSEDALAVLKANADVLRANPDLEVRVAGNCDERGTVAYNLALGQKRANQVRDYYVQIGIEKGRIATISYGKEQPLCTESNEDCWTKNRRAETAARSKSGAPAVPAATPTPDASAAPAPAVPAATPNSQ
jgi:peptidoglycan-associated lipoprotein